MVGLMIVLLVGLIVVLVVMLLAGLIVPALLGWSLTGRMYLEDSIHELIFKKLVNPSLFNSYHPFSHKVAETIHLIL